MCARTLYAIAKAIKAVAKATEEAGLKADFAKGIFVKA